MATSIKGWFTVNGVHIPIMEGENKSQAYNKYKNNLNNSKATSGKYVKNAKEKYDDSKYKYLSKDEDEAHDKYWDMSDECYDKLSSADRDLINKHYVKTEESYYINSALREKGYNKLSDRRKEQVDALDRACKTYTAKEDMASTRFVELSYLQNAYNIKGDDRYSYYEQMKSYIGTKISSQGFTSVSLNEDGNGMFNSLAVNMKINIPKGTSMYVAENWSEAEAILGRNTKFELKAVSFKESQLIKDDRFGQILLTYEVVK